MNLFSPLPMLEDLGPRERKPMPCSFLFQFQSSHKPSWATPARGKMNYLCRCQNAVLLGGARELAHTRGSLCAATAAAQQTLLWSAASLCHPSAFPCPSHASTAKVWLVLQCLILESPSWATRGGARQPCPCPGSCVWAAPPRSIPGMGTAVTPAYG